MGDSSDSGRPGYSYEEVKAILGNARLPRNPAEEQAFAREDAYNNGRSDGRQEVIAFIEANFLKIENPVWLSFSQVGKIWATQCEKWAEKR